MGKWGLMNVSQKIFCKKAFSLMEYIALTGFILAALFVFQHYIVRGLSGRFKNTGDTFGQMKQFDPRPYGSHGEGGGTLECVYWDRDGAGPLPGVWCEGSYFDHCTTDDCRNLCPQPADCGG